MQGHVLAGGDDEDPVGVAVPHGQGKAAADHVAQHVVDDDIGLKALVGPFFLQLFQGGDDAPAGAAQTGGGAARLHADHARVAHAHHVVQAVVLLGADQVQHGGRLLALPEQHGGIGLGIAADLHDLIALFRPGRRQIGRRGGFAAAAFAV